MENPAEDLSFIDSLQGTKLNLKQDDELESSHRSMMDKFQSLKHKIEQPFDEKHREFIQLHCKKGQPMNKGS